MPEGHVSPSKIKPVAQCVDRGKLITQDFISTDGRILAGYRMVPEATGFPAWIRSGDLNRGYGEKMVFWFPTVDEARTWVEAQISGESQSPPTTERATGSTPHQEKAA
jgi:hypothetical protein